MVAYTLRVVAFLAVAVACTAQLTVRTNTPRWISTDVWRTSGPNGSLVTGPIQTSPALIIGSRMYLQVPQAMIALNLDLTTSTQMINNAFVLSYPQLPALAAAVDDPTNSGRMIVLSQSPTRIAYMNTTTLAFIAITNPGYPITVGSFGNNPVRGVFKGTAEDAFFIAVSSNGFAKSNYDLRSPSLDFIQFGETDTVLSANYDDATRSLYLGMNGGRLWKYRLSSPTDALTNATFSELTFTNETSDIVSVLFELNRNRIYAVSAGISEGNTSTIYRITADTFALESTLRLSGQDFATIDAVIDTVRGYIVMLSKPADIPRIAQVDLPTFTQEYSTPFIEYSDRVDQLSSIILDAANKRLIVASVDALAQTQLTLLRASDNCPGECFGHGNCSYRTCTCSLFVSNLTGETLRWLEPSCEGRTCERNCSSTPDVFQGTCSFNGSCICDRIWTGRFCDVRQCPLNCSGNGVCGGASSNYTCSCNDGFSGDACNQVALLRCPLYRTCSDCGLNPACGWCADAAGGSSGYCMYGNARGPSDLNGTANASCRNWHYQECDVIVGIINWVITALLALVLIVALLSVPLEFAAGNGEEYSRRLSWYRFQRSGKVLTLFTQLCYVGALTFLRDTLPTAFTTFTRTWLWPLFAIGLPFNKWISGLELGRAFEAASAPTTRALLSADQYIVYAETYIDFILPGVLFWWVVILAICYVLFFISIGLAKVLRGDREHATGQWLLYILFSGLNWGYFPLTLSGFVQLGLGSRTLVSIAGAAVVLLIGVGYPAFIFFIIHTQDRKLFAEHNKIRFFPLIGHAVPRHLKFAIAPYAKHFLIALWLGVLNTSSTIAQLILCMIVFVAWAVLVAIKGEVLFSDYLQRRLEVVISIVHFISFGIILAFAASLTGPIITGISLAFIIVQLIGVVVCLLFFVITWLQAREVYSCAQFRDFLCCRDPSEK